MTKKKGQGFARRVSLDNLDKFAPLLGAKASGSSSSTSGAGKAAAEKAPPDPALRDAEALFDGETFESSLPFTRPGSGKSSATKQGATAQGAGAGAASTPTGGASASGTPAPPSAPSGGVPASPMGAADAPAHGRLRWEKDLSATDAQRQAGNPTGDIRLTAARWKEGGKVINHTTYFRNDLFGGFRWVAKNTKVEEAVVPFDVTMLGKSYGVRNLTVSHKPSGEAGQHNYTTGLQWGDLMPVTKAHDLTGRTIRIYDPPMGATTPFYIEIT